MLQACVRHLKQEPHHVMNAHVLHRAGRDGREAWCILYYNYSDAQRMRSMINESAKENGTPPEHVQCNMDSLNCMVRSLAVVCLRACLLDWWQRCGHPVHGLVASSCVFGAPGHGLVAALGFTLGAVPIPAFPVG